MDHTPPPPQQMFQLITGYWATQIVASVARLGIADALADGPRSAAELAGIAGVHAGALARVLRAAATLGVLRAEAGRYALTPVGETLRDGVPGSMRGMAIAQAAPGHWLPWGHLDDVVKTGQRATPAALGMEIWEHYAAHPAEGAAFSSAMANLSALVAGDVAGLPDLDGKRVVDVGGAHGTLLSAIVARHPAATGILFDRPDVVAGARGLDRRIECVGGDFLAAVPGGDVYLLKQILHDWDDAAAATILSRCAATASPGARLLVVEMVIEDGVPGPASMMDVNMLVMLTGKERTSAEFRALFAGAGWTLERTVPIHAGFSILDARR